MLTYNLELWYIELWYISIYLSCTCLFKNSTVEGINETLQIFVLLMESSRASIYAPNIWRVCNLMHGTKSFLTT